MYARAHRNAPLHPRGWEVGHRSPMDVRAREAESVMDAVLDALAQPALILDQSGKVRGINRAARKEGHHMDEDLIAREIPPGGARDAVRAEVLHGAAICFPGRGREWRTAPLRLTDERVLSVCISDDER